MAVRKKARTLKQWEPPPDYREKPGLKSFLKNLSPRMNTAEMDMVIYCDWRTRPFWQKSVNRAWRELGMTPLHARDAFEKRLIFMEIFDRAVARAKDRTKRARQRAMPTRG